MVTRVMVATLCPAVHDLPSDFPQSTIALTLDKQVEKVRQNGVKIHFQDGDVHFRADETVHIQAFRSHLDH